MGKEYVFPSHFYKLWLRKAELQPIKLAARGARDYSHPHPVYSVLYSKAFGTQIPKHATIVFKVVKDESCKFKTAKATMCVGRLLTMSPLYPSSKPCSTGNHIEAVRKLTLFFAFSNRIMMESRFRMSNPVGMLSVFQSKTKFRHIVHTHSNSQIS